MKSLGTESSLAQLLQMHHRSFSGNSQIMSTQLLDISGKFLAQVTFTSWRSKKETQEKRVKYFES